MDVLLQSDVLILHDAPEHSVEYWIDIEPFPSLDKLVSGYHYIMELNQYLLIANSKQQYCTIQPFQVDKEEML